MHQQFFGGGPGCTKPKKAQKWSGRAEKKLSEMVWEKPKRLRNGLELRNAQKGSEPSPKKLAEGQRGSKIKAPNWSGRKAGRSPRNGLGSPNCSVLVRKREKRSEMVREKQAPQRFRGGLSLAMVLRGGPQGCTSKSGGGAGLHEQRSLGGGPGCTSNGPWGGARLHQQKVLGLGSLPLTLKGSTALTASVGLTLPWSVQQPQLYLGCTFSALRSLAKLGRLRALKCW